MADPGQVRGQLAVVLAVDLEQHVEPAEAGGQRSRVGAGVVDGVAQQDRRAPPGPRADSSSRATPRAKPTLVRPRAGRRSRSSSTLGRRAGPSQWLDHDGVLPEGDDGQLVVHEVAGERGDGGGGDADLLAPHRTGHVHHQGDRPPAPHALPHHDVGVLGHGPLGQHLEGAVEVDVVGPVAVRARWPAGPSLGPRTRSGGRRRTLRRRAIAAAMRRTSGAAEAGSVELVQRAPLTGLGRRHPALRPRRSARPVAAPPRRCGRRRRARRRGSRPPRPEQQGRLVELLGPPPERAQPGARRRPPRARQSNGVGQLRRGPARPPGGGGARSGPPTAPG